MTKKIETNAFLSNLSDARLTPQVPEVSFYGTETNELEEYEKKGWTRKVSHKGGKYLTPTSKKQASYGITHMTRLGFEANKVQLKKAYLNSHRLKSVDPKVLEKDWEKFEKNLNEYFDAMDTEGFYKIKKYIF